MSEEVRSWTSTVTQTLTLTFPPPWLSKPCPICGDTTGRCCSTAHFFASNPDVGAACLYCSCPRCTPSC